MYNNFYKNLKYPFYNVGSGEEVTIKKLTSLLKNLYPNKLTVKFTGEESNGTPRKVLDSSRIRALGWKPRVSLIKGLSKIMSSKGLLENEN